MSNRHDRRRAASNARRAHHHTPRITESEILSQLSAPSCREFVIGGAGWAAEAARLFGIYAIPFISDDGDITVNVQQLPAEQRYVLARMIYSAMSEEEQ